MPYLFVLLGAISRLRVRLRVCVYAGIKYSRSTVSGTGANASVTKLQFQVSRSTCLGPWEMTYVIH